MSLREDAAAVIRRSIHNTIPAKSIKDAVVKLTIPEGGQLYVIAVGSAAYTMAEAAYQALGDQIFVGVIITRYGYMKEDIPRFASFEAGYPLPDDRSYEAAQHVLDLTGGLSEKDRVLFLLSGGASSLFELPTISADEYRTIVGKLLAAGADQTELNTVRKRFSQVKGGRYALTLSPAKVYTLVLSNVAGDPLDVIGSGPTFPDFSRAETARGILERYGISLSEEASKMLDSAPDKKLGYADAVLVGNGKRLVQGIREACEEAGYETFVLTDCLSCDAGEAGRFLGSVAKSHQDVSCKTAYIAAGSLQASVKGNRWGTPNQELALTAAESMAGVKKTVLFSIASSGSDGYTDAAGALIDGQTRSQLLDAGYPAGTAIYRGQCYEALKSIRSLIVTGPTGTDVGSFSVILIDR